MLHSESRRRVILRAYRIPHSALAKNSFGGVKECQEKSRERKSSAKRFRVVQEWFIRD